jgi:hypothetical protein
MNIWAKLSLSCVPVALFVLMSAYTLKISELYDVLLPIGMYLPVLGGFLAFGARKLLQIVLLALLNFCYFPVLMVTIMFAASS